MPFDTTTDADTMKPDEKHPHYYRFYRRLKIDLYRLIDLFGPMEGAQQHALKKIMFAGDRPDEGKVKDIREAIDSLNRWLEMIEEDEEDATEAQDTTAQEEAPAPVLPSVLAKARRQPVESIAVDLSSGELETEEEKQGRIAEETVASKLSQ